MIGASEIAAKVSSAFSGLASKLFPRAQSPVRNLIVSLVGVALVASTAGVLISGNVEVEQETLYVGKKDPCEDVEEETCDATSSGAEAFVAAAQKELRDWESGAADYHRYKDPWEQNAQDGGWCGFFIKYLGTQLGSSTEHWQGDAFPPDCTWPGCYYEYYSKNPDAGQIIENGPGVKPEPGDILVMWNGAHVEMVEQVDDDGFWCIAGGGSVDHNRHSFGSGNDTWFFRPNFDKIANPKFKVSSGCDKKGKGDIEVPESMEFINDKEHGSICPGPDRFNATIGDIGSWEGNVNVAGGLRSLGLIGDVLKMADFYDANGGYTDEAGFERIKNIGDYYILAIGAYPYAAPGNDMVQIGDHLTLYYDDGTEIDALVGDWKGWEFERNPSLVPTDKGSWVYIETEHDPQGRDGYGAGWGHGPFQGDGGSWHCNVTEFWGSDGSGDPMAGALQKSTGGSMKRLVGVTNHGVLAEFASFSGGSGSSSSSGTMVDTASQSANRSRNKVDTEDVQDCSGDKDKEVDNSTLAAAMASYSYSQKKYFHDDDGKTYPGTELYDKVWQATIHDDYYRSCDRGVAAAVKWSGADDNFDYFGCSSEHNYLEGATNLWKKVASGVVLTGDDASAISQYNLQPGDVFCTVANEHTFAYVGEDIVNQVYENTIKGTDGDVGAPEPGTCWMSASIGSNGAQSTRDSGPDNGKAPGLYAGASDSRAYDAFRYIGNYPDKDKYADVGTKASARAQGKSKVPCECQEEEDCGSNNLLDDFIESAKAEVEEHSRLVSQGSGVGMKYQEEMKKIGEQAEPGCSALNWGGQCSEFCWYNLHKVGLEPGKHMPEGYNLNTFSSSKWIIDNHPEYGEYHNTEEDPSYIPRVGDIAFMGGGWGAHFEIVTAVDTAAGTWETAASGGAEAVAKQGTLDTSGKATSQEIGGMSYAAYFSFNWDKLSEEIRSDKNCKKDEDLDDFTGGKGTLTPEQRKKIVEFAKSQVGKADYNSGCPPNYCTGGSCDNDIPFQQLSCNGLTFHAYKAAGIDIPCDSRGQISGAPTVTSTGKVSDMTAGDIIVFDEAGRRSDVPNLRTWSYRHVAIYAGNGQMIESTISGGFHGVRTVPIEDNGYSYSITW